MILPERVLGSSGTTMICRGLAIAPISLATWSAQLLDQVRGAAVVRRDSRRITKAQTAWPVVSSVGAHDRRLGDLGVGDQGGLDLGGGEPVAGDVHDVVDAAEQPDVAVLVLLRAVAGEVEARGKRDQ